MIEKTEVLRKSYNKKNIQQKFKIKIYFDLVVFSRNKTTLLKTCKFLKKCL